jgi:alanine racemase
MTADLPVSPLRLTLSSTALAANWRWLADQSGAAACGAAIKADGYGLGAREVLRVLQNAGCRDFYVATWAEALPLLPHLDGCGLSVFHGVREADMGVALGSGARPVLNSPAQVARWREAGGGPCDIMIDTGMNRLGIDADGTGGGLLDGLAIDTVMSHLACADEDHHFNGIQQMIFGQLARRIDARRKSLANSAGILLGASYAFDLTRPGLALYGGIPRAEADGHIRPVLTLEAQILQRRTVRGGESVGYGARFVSERQLEAAVLNLGYADGYLCGFTGTGRAFAPDGEPLRVLGRVSMDLLVVDVSARPDLAEGEWLAIDYDLPRAAEQSGLSQYELLTGLGQRFERRWTD